MCGIFGLVSRSGDMAPVLPEMSALIRHRGPDGEGFVLFRGDEAPLVRGGVDTPAHLYNPLTAYSPERPISREDHAGARIALGHRRLAIVDLSEFGHQPMTSPGGDHWIVFNGEVYNHVELRAELEALGHHFPSHSDTAVILAAYKQWGVDCLTRFNGMFAFVIYDRARDIMFLARDRFGVKPLHLWSDGRTFAFTSEIKTLLAVPDFVPSARIDGLRRYLIDGPTEYEPDSLFEGVNRLPAASYILASPASLLDGRATPVRWWSLQPNPSKEPYQDAVAARLADEYRERLSEAVRIRLRADVTIGSALSGGLDSSSIVSLIAEQLGTTDAGGRQKTFSSVYPGEAVRHCDESVYIREIAEQLNVSMNLIEPQAQDVPVEHRKMIWAMDTPPESTCMSGWHTFKLVNRTGVKVTLDGQGADELLGGYPHYLPHAIAGRPLPRAIANGLSLSRMLPPVKALGSLGMGLGLLPQPLLRNERQRTTAGFLKEGLNNHLVHDCRTHLGNLLHYADRASMAFSVESRTPFLDFRLAEFLAATPESYKIHDGWSKHLARKAFTERLPGDVVWRRDKMGWPVPEATWAAGPLKTWFDEAADHVSYFDDLGVGEEYRAAFASPDVTLRIRALNLAAWRTIFLDGGWKTGDGRSSDGADQAAMSSTWV